MPSTVLPLRVTSGLPFLRVEDGWFVVDTGLPRSFSPTHRRLCLETCGLDVDIPLLPPTLGPPPHAVFDAVEEQVGLRPVGFVGMDVLEELGAFCLDYPGRTLTVGPLSPESWDQELPMTGTGWPLRVAGDLLVDTGAVFAVSRDPPRRPGGPLRIHTFGGALDVDLGLEELAPVGRAVVMHHPAVGQRLPPGTRGLLGAETLARGRLGVDFRARRLCLQDAQVRPFPLLAVDEHTRWPRFQVDLRGGAVRVAARQVPGVVTGEHLDLGVAPPGVERVDHVLGQLFTRAAELTLVVEGQPRLVPTFPLFP